MPNTPDYERFDAIAQLGLDDARMLKTLMPPVANDLTLLAFALREVTNILRRERGE